MAGICIHIVFCDKINHKENQCKRLRGPQGNKFFSSHHNIFMMRNLFRDYYAWGFLKIILEIYDFGGRLCPKSTTCKQIFFHFRFLDIWKRLWVHCSALPSAGDFL